MRLIALLVALSVMRVVCLLLLSVGVASGWQTKPFTELDAEAENANRQKKIEMLRKAVRGFHAWLLPHALKWMKSRDRVVAVLSAAFLARTLPTKRFRSLLVETVTKHGIPESALVAVSAAGRGDEHIARRIVELVAGPQRQQALHALVLLYGCGRLKAPGFVQEAVRQAWRRQQGVGSAVALALLADKLAPDTADRIAKILLPVVLKESCSGVQRRAFLRALNFCPEKSITELLPHLPKDADSPLAGSVNSIIEKRQIADPEAFAYAAGIWGVDFDYYLKVREILPADVRDKALRRIARDAVSELDFDWARGLAMVRAAVKGRLGKKAVEYLASAADTRHKKALLAMALVATGNAEKQKNLINRLLDEAEKMAPPQEDTLEGFPPLSYPAATVEQVRKLLAFLKNLKEAPEGCGDLRGYLMRVVRSGVDEGVVAELAVEFARLAATGRKRPAVWYDDFSVLGRRLGWESLKRVAEVDLGAAVALALEHDRVHPEAPLAVRVLRLIRGKQPARLLWALESAAFHERCRAEVARIVATYPPSANPRRLAWILERLGEHAPQDAVLRLLRHFVRLRQSVKNERSDEYLDEMERLLWVLKRLPAEDAAALAEFVCVKGGWHPVWWLRYALLCRDELPEHVRKKLMRWLTPSDFNPYLRRVGKRLFADADDADLLRYLSYLANGRYMIICQLIPPPNRGLTNAVVSALRGRVDWVVEAALNILVTTPWFAPRWEQLLSLLKGRPKPVQEAIIEALLRMAKTEHRGGDALQEVKVNLKEWEAYKEATHLYRWGQTAECEQLLGAVCRLVALFRENPQVMVLDNKRRPHWFRRWIYLDRAVLQLAARLPRNLKEKVVRLLFDAMMEKYAELGEEALLRLLVLAGFLDAQRRWRCCQRLVEDAANLRRNRWRSYWPMDVLRAIYAEAGVKMPPDLLDVSIPALLEGLTQKQRNWLLRNILRLPPVVAAEIIKRLGTERLDPALARAFRVLSPKIK